MHSIAEVVASPATEKGALDGFEAVCTCGYRIRSSLRTCAVSDGHRHADFMNTKEAANAAMAARIRRGK